MIDAILNALSGKTLNMRQIHQTVCHNTGHDHLYSSVLAEVNGLLRKGDIRVDGAGYTLHTAD